MLKLEPNSKIAQIEINKIDNALEKNNLVFPIIKSESQRSKKPLVRVKIEDINVEETSTERAKIREDLANIQQKIKLTEKDQELFKVSKPKIEELSKDEPAHEKTEIVKKKEDDSSNIKKIDSIKPSSTIQLPKSIPESPSNSYQFKKDWQYLCGSLDNLAAYLKVRILRFWKKKIN